MACAPPLPKSLGSLSRLPSHRPTPPLSGPPATLPATLPATPSSDPASDPASHPCLPPLPPTLLPQARLRCQVQPYLSNGLLALHLDPLPLHVPPAAAARSAARGNSPHQRHSSPPRLPGFSSGPWRRGVLASRCAAQGPMGGCGAAVSPGRRLGPIPLPWRHSPRPRPSPHRRTTSRGGLQMHGCTCRQIEPPVLATAARAAVHALHVHRAPCTLRAPCRLYAAFHPPGAAAEPAEHAAPLGDRVLPRGK